MGASTSSSAAAAAASGIPTDGQFRRGKLACRFLMISNCALAVYVITRPRKRERSKTGAVGGNGGVDEGVRDVGQQLVADADVTGAEVRMEEH